LQMCEMAWNRCFEYFVRKLNTHMSPLYHRRYERNMNNNKKRYKKPSGV
jgi:hypothetical protein